MEQPTPVWSMPNDNQTQNLQPSSQTSTTTILPQTHQQQPPPHITIYKQPQYVRAFTDGAILVVDKDNTTTDQLLIDSGAITSVASKHHFNHIPIKQLRHRDPQELTA
eukprot:2922849-Amphidinium_carterae.1